MALVFAGNSWYFNDIMDQEYTSYYVTEQDLRNEQLRRQYADTLTGELGHLAIAAVTGGTVDAQLTNAEYTKHTERTVETQALYEHTALLGSYATSELVHISPVQLDERHMALGYAQS